MPLKWLWPDPVRDIHGDLRLGWESLDERHWDAMQPDKKFRQRGATPWAYDTHEGFVCATTYFCNLGPRSWFK